MVGFGEFGWLKFQDANAAFSQPILRIITTVRAWIFSRLIFHVFWRILGFWGRQRFGTLYRGSAQRNESMVLSKQPISGDQLS